jgi:hypothetical protein
LAELARLLNISINGTFVEFGTESGSQINTRYLRENFGWTGRMYSHFNAKKSLFNKIILLFLLILKS